MSDDDDDDLDDVKLSGGDVKFIETDVNYAHLDRTIALYQEIESEDTDVVRHDT